MGRLNHKSGRAGWKILLAAGPAAALAAVFALGVPEAGSGQPCQNDKDCPAGEACGGDVCESIEGGCGGEQDSGIGTADNQAEGAQVQQSELQQVVFENAVIEEPVIRNSDIPLSSLKYTGVSQHRTVVHRNCSLGTDSCPCKTPGTGGSQKGCPDGQLCISVQWVKKDGTRCVSEAGCVTPGMKGPYGDDPFQRWYRRGEDAVPPWPNGGPYDNDGWVWPQAQL